jgi:hypothetical protein
MTLRLVLLYRDLLAATVEAREASASPTATAQRTASLQPAAAPPASATALDPGSIAMRDRAPAPELVPPPGLADAAAELPLHGTEPPVLEERAPVDHGVPPELGDGLTSRDARGS